MEVTNCVVPKKQNEGGTDFCIKYALLRRTAAFLFEIKALADGKTEHSNRLLGNK